MTSNCWQVLELERGSDERAIKRRYAQLLKVTRPDEDPEGFQRLRSAYEHALAYAQSEVEDEVEVEVEVEETKAEPALAAMPEPSLPSHEAWLREAFAGLQVAQLDALLAAARERNCLALFEQHLLGYCLSDAEHAAACVDWALVHLQWLTPWQSGALSAPQTEVLATQLLQRSILAMSAALAAEDEAQALQHLHLLWNSAPLQSFERRDWARQQLVAWLAEDEFPTPGFVQAFCALLELETEDALFNQQDWQVRQLLSYAADQQLLNRLRKQLAVTWPTTAQEKAAWMLLKDMGAGYSRRLADSLGEEGWQACEKLAIQLAYDSPQLIPQLREAGLRDWRKWQAKAQGDWTNVWLIGLATLAHAAPALGHWLGLSEPPTERVRSVVEYLSLGFFSMLLLHFLGLGLKWLSTELAVADAWLSTRVLPPKTSNGGAGFLLLRHGLPCALLASLCGAWAESWMFGCAVGIGATLYALVNLRKDQTAKVSLVVLVRNAWQAHKRVIGWVAVAVAVLVGLATRLNTVMDVQPPDVQSPCAQLRGQDALDCVLKNAQTGK